VTGAAIVRRHAADAVVLAVHGCFDGASAWALRIEMDESAARDFVIDLTRAEEACDFAACILASYVRQRWRDRRVRFCPGTDAHARLLAGYGLELCEPPPLGHEVGGPGATAANEGAAPPAPPAPGRDALGGETGAAA
jgi:hypothetical protein